MKLGELEEIYEVDGEPNPETEPILIEDPDEELVPAQK